MNENEKEILDEVNNLVEEVQKNEEELVELENKVLNYEMQRLRKVIEIAKKGIKFEKLMRRYETYNNFNNYRSDEIEYLVDDQGKFLKGIEVATIEISSNVDGYGGKEKEKQLFLLSDGTLKVLIHQECWSNYQDDSSLDEWVISKKQDVSQFDTNEIIQEIIQLLNTRLKELRDRNKSQLKRLEKLEGLRIK